MAYPVEFDIEPPDEFDKAQILLRVLIVIVVSWLFEAVLNLAYFALPVVAAIMISQRGPDEYLAGAESGPTRWLRFIMGIFSYIALATDDASLNDPDRVELDIQPTGSPTVGSALLRLITGIPHVIVLALLGIPFAVAWLIAALSILINGEYPEWASSFIRGYLRWWARFLAYMASLVDEYPPFSFEDDGLPALPPSAGETPPDA